MVFALKTNHNDKYLRFRYEEIITYGLFKASADKVTDSYAQFEFLNSNTHRGLVHIRCRYNNKYLVRWSSFHWWLIASADKPNDDKNHWGCTLFERFDLGDGKLRLKHVQLGHYARVYPAGIPFDNCLFAHQTEVDHQDSMDVFTLVNLNTLFSPVSKRVAFRGTNGKYLGAHIKNGLPYLQFSYDNPGDPKAMHEMFNDGASGLTYIKSNYNDKFWNADSDNWIRADSEGPLTSQHDVATAIFRTIPLGINVIGLLNMRIELAVKRDTSSSGFQDCLRAAVEDVNQDGVLEVIELEGIIDQY